MAQKENQKRVLDSSALLAWIFQETGWQQVNQILEAHICLLSWVNLAEITAKLIDLDFAQPEQTHRLLRLANIEFMTVTESQVMHSALLRKPPRQKALSLGDRFCLALAMEENASVVTADKLWSSLKLPVKVIDIR